ncbi:MAG: CoA-binding protein, partial [Candidatus Omnitrophica bacterium]|nr:CoA-binding protein [Candidatus Omnitrophota bacterium]
MKNVAVIGASDKPERYSYKAVKLLQEKGYHAFPVHPRIKAIDGQYVYPSLGAISEDIDVVSLYVSDDISTKIADAILQKFPKKIIFNP